jgi:hypothetical protein
MVSCAPQPTQIDVGEKSGLWVIWGPPIVHRHPPFGGSSLDGEGDASRLGFTRLAKRGGGHEGAEAVRAGCGLASRAGVGRWRPRQVVRKSP